jgi:large subunit ribosomal protein L21
MYAVIRTGGKQYRIAPGDIVKVEKFAANQGDIVEFKDVLAVSGEDGKIGPGNDVMVSGQVMDTGRSDKILVFHYKRKKQYKKIYGHRQPYTEVRITEIAFDGQRFTAPDLPPPKPKAAPRVELEEAEHESQPKEHKAHGASPKKAAAKKASSKKTAKKPAAKKSSSAKKKK